MSQAILELTSREGYETVVNFVPDEDIASEAQVNQIAQNFTDIREAILTLFGKKHGTMVNYYKCTPKRNHLHMIRTGYGRW